MVMIHLISADSPIKVFELIEDLYTIGRGESNTIRLLDVRSSRNHAKITSENEQYFLTDIGSANGTILNGNRIAVNSPQLLLNDDKILIGTTELQVSGILAPSPEAPKLYNAAEPLFNSLDCELSATLDASISMAQLSAEDSSDAVSMQKALKRMEAMCLISEATGNIMDLEKLTTTVLKTVFGLFPKADRSFLLLKNGDDYLPIAAQDRNNHKLELKELKNSNTVLTTCIDEKKSILSNNTANDERFNEAHSIAELEIESFVCSPLITNDEVLGMIQIDGKVGGEEFNETDLQIITGISSQIAIAIKNIHLAKEIEKETTQRANLQRYFSPNMVDMMLSGDINTELGGKEYTGTIFFSDIIGFTAMSEKMSAKAVVVNLNQYFTVMQNLIYQNNGNVDKFGGDSIMSFWSVPNHATNDELHAVLTGVQMQSALYSFNLSLKKDNLQTIYMGIGINTGNFIAGNVGSEEKIEFTLIGDDVNIAARIEAKAGKTQVICSKETYDKVAEHVTAVELPPVMFKGKSEPQILYSIRGAIDSDGSLATNIPLRLTSTEETIPDDFFMLVKVITIASERCIVIEKSEEHEIGTSLSLRCCLNEYHESITFSGSILQKTELIYRDNIKYYCYTLNNIQGEKFIEISRAGYKYTTGLSWDKMSRDRIIEGN